MLCRAVCLHAPSPSPPFSVPPFPSHFTPRRFPSKRRPSHSRTTSGKLSSSVAGGSRGGSIQSVVEEGFGDSSGPIDRRSSSPAATGQQHRSSTATQPSQPYNITVQDTRRNRIVHSQVQISTESLLDAYPEEEDGDGDDGSNLLADCPTLLSAI